MNEKQNYQGMLLILKKRMKCIQEDDECQFKIFGHYDGLDIWFVEHWFEMRPKGVTERDGNISLEDNFRDKYILKVYFPNETKIKKLFSEHGVTMDYGIWKTVSRRISQRSGQENDEYKRLCSEYPFLSLVLLNISEPMVQKPGDVFHRIGTCIANASAKAGVNIKDIHGALFPSLGFCDYVLMFLSKNLEEVMHFLDYLKEEKVPDEKKPAISSLYPIIGFEKLGLEKLDDLSIENINISVRINLQEGVSNRWFQNKLKENLPVNMKDSVMNQLFGNSDCLLMPSVSFKDCIPLYFGEKIFSPESPFFCQYICQMHSSVRISPSPCEQGENVGEYGEELGKWLETRRNTIEKYRSQFWNIIKILNDTAEKYEMPIRTVNGIQNMMKTFLDLIRSSHCFDLEKIIGQMFDALLKNIDRNLSYAKDLGDDRERTMIHEMWSALGFFREFVGGYLNDMQRSDRSFIEGHILAHQSIGSSTKLLLFYNSFVACVSKKLEAIENDSKEYTFLVTSGGTDVTEAIDLFSHLDSAESGNYPMIVLAIPEMSLYDIRGTMFRLLHECLHFCGERKRKERYIRVLEAVSAYSAMFFCKMENVRSKELFMQNVFLNLKHIFSEKKMEEISEKWEKEIEGIYIDTEQSVQKVIQELFESNLEMNSADYYGRYLYDFIEEVAYKNVFVPNMPEDDALEKNLSSQLYEAFQELRIHYAEKLEEILYEEGIPFSNANFMEQAARGKSQLPEKRRIYDIENRGFVAELMEYYMGKETECQYLILDDGDEIHFRDLLNNLRGMFKECFADCIAAKILGADFADVVMGTFYETWDEERAFPSNSFEKLRRMTEIDILNADADSLRAGIARTKRYWEDNGYTIHALKDDADIERLTNRILGDYDKRDYDSLLNPVENYLRECMELYSDVQSFENEREIFELAAFQKKGDLLMLLDKISDSWKMYAEVDKGNADS